MNFGIFPVSFINTADFEKLEQGDVIVLKNIHSAVEKGRYITVTIEGNGYSLLLQYDLSDRQVYILMAGGLINMK